MSVVSSIPVDTADAVRDLQDRVGRNARTMSLISIAMLLATFANALMVNEDSFPVWNTSRAIHVGASAFGCAVWLLARGRTLPIAAIRSLDVGFTWVVCTLWPLLGYWASPTSPVEFSVILATTYTLIARSVVVPSTFFRTFGISAVAVIPTLVLFHVREMSFAGAIGQKQLDSFLFFSTLWCLVAVFVASLQSRLLYGLREKIREASRLGQYTLEEKIGEGGMGVVYRATHAMLRRPAAIKLLLAERAGERDLARFEREVQQTSRLMHPNTISIFDYGRTADGTFYYVMEYLDGFDLEWLVEAEGPLEPSRVIRILTQASGALAEAHALELIHRDIKPANLILTERPDEPDVVKVVDFGLVKTLSKSADPGLSQTNAITGTPLYLSPEAIAAPDAVDHRSDLYALGAVGYYLITGRLLFEARTVVELCSKHLLEPPVPPSERLGRSLPDDLEALILSCLAKSPTERPASALAMREALLGCAERSPYDSAVARRFWVERAPRLRSERRTAHPSEPSRTMAVDLDARPA
jgi:eukaryotic-like serine/threonine-protein kinase